MLYASVYDETQPTAFLDPSTLIGKHTLWLGVSMLVLILTLVVDWQVWNSLAYPIYILTIVLLVAVLIVGSEIKGAKSWFAFAGFSFQPSELAKFGTALAVSSYLSYYDADISERRTLLVSLGLILTPMQLILLQPDAGSALIFLSFFMLLYLKGLSPIPYVIFGSLAAIFIGSLVFGPAQVCSLVLIVCVLSLLQDMMPKRNLFLAVLILLISFFLAFRQNWGMPLMIGLAVVFAGLGIYKVINRKPDLITVLAPLTVASFLFAYGSNYAFNNVLEPHQQDRINVWLRPDKCDPRGSLYNILQSKLAIGSGGFQGKGFLQGTMTKLNYVPEQSTDFIFSIVGEEQGFIGTTMVILVFVGLLLKMMQIAKRAKNAFIRNYAYAVAGLLFVHFVVNIGMSVGLMPVIGIPLPFLSKGGSALLAFTLMIGVLLKMDLARLRS